MSKAKSFAMSLLLVLAAAFALPAQNTRTLTGAVLDTQQQPIAGAALIVKGHPSMGVVTEENGTFLLSVPVGEVVLQVNCLGYSDQEVTVPASRDRITVVLQEDNQLLNETVVVGYGVQKKVNLTGAVTQVDSKSLENRSAHSVSNMLQGSVPGLNISTSAGSPGSAGSLNIRGYTSINGASPLVLIDGAIGDL